MQKFTFSLTAALAAVLLAASTTQAQTATTFISTSLAAASTEEVASLGSPATGVTESPTAAGHKRSAPADETTTAAYYNDAHKDLKQALAWMQETNALHPEYWSVYAEARIRLQLKDYAGAQATAAEAKKLALAAANGDYAHRCDEVIARAQAQRH